ncbi:hypothetical protein K7432_012779 [Basidiobolus ranarum]|uniref:Uncharacterized protein n=1 Tax=Basidiobolus ranarum TaxID=34480 RepID=A0ABR2WK83_9FUNG
MSQISTNFLEDAHRYYEILSSREGQLPKPGNSTHRRLRTQRSIEEAKAFCLKSEYRRPLTSTSNGKPQKRAAPNVRELSTRLEQYLKLTVVRNVVPSRDLLIV